MIDNVAVCDGVASAFKLMCLIEGIPCVKVSGLGVGSGGGEPHAWNKVYLDGKWYIVDATWARMSDTTNGRYYVNHSYFLIPEEEAIATHVENCDHNSVGDTAVISVIAEGEYNVYSSDYMTMEISGKNYDMYMESEAEFLSTLTAFYSTSEKILEFKLDFDYGTLSSLLSNAKIPYDYSYYSTDAGVLIILNK